MIPSKAHLQPTAIIDSDHDTIKSFARQHTDREENAREQAVSLYYAVRDGIRYNPYSIELTVEALRASTTLITGQAWCIPKAALLTACCRSLGIHARVGFADVRNHLSTARLRSQMKTDIFYWHGYTSIYLDGEWVKATPAFNVELCQKFQLKTLEFNGMKDSIYQPFDLEGNRHMDYIRFRGEYNDVPLEEIRQSFNDSYGESAFKTKGTSFDEDVERETRTESGFNYK